MPACSAVPVVLTAAERHRLKKLAYSPRTPHQMWQRATVVLLAAPGRSNARIAVETCLHVDTVRTWRGRFAVGGLPALADRIRCGRPARFTPVQVAEAKALACQLPAETSGRRHFPVDRQEAWQLQTGLSEDDSETSPWFVGPLINSALPGRSCRFRGRPVRPAAWRVHGRRPS